MTSHFLRKKISISLILSSLACVCLITACKTAEAKELAAPTNIRLEEETLIWEAVEDAVGYRVDINGEKEYEAESNRLDVFVIISEPKTYEIRVKAVGNQKNREDSVWSEPIEYTLEMPQGWALRPINDNTEYEIGLGDAAKLKGKLSIPSTYAGKPITKITDNAFRNCTGLTGVVLPVNIKSIGYSAFAGCTNLKRVFCSRTVGTIGSRAFEDCSSLTDVALSASLTRLSHGMFYGCSALSEITIPRHVDYIDSLVFGECGNLSSITVAEENATFQSDGNCIIRKADNAVIVGCKTSVIPDYVKTIEESAWNLCTGLTEFVVPGNVETIKESAFARCGALRSIRISEGVKIIGKIGNTQFSSASEVFAGCINLTGLEIPASVEYLGFGMTGNCPKLTELTVKEGNAVYKSEGNCIIRRSDNVLMAGCQTSVIPDYVTGIADYIFYGGALTELVVPEGVEKIGRYAFSESKLEKITLPSTLKTIGANAFAYCGNLSEIQIPYGVTSIGAEAFLECSRLKYLAIPESVKEIGEDAFYRCYFLTLVLPESVETIGGGAFDNATIYTSVGANYPEGWYKKDPNGLGYISWAIACNIIQECTFGYDDGQPYVFSCVWIEGDNTPCSIVMNEKGVKIPHREGYTFMGWALEEGSDEVVYGKTPFEPDDPKDDLLYNTLPAKELKTIPTGTVLYAVWVLDE